MARVRECIYCSEEFIGVGKQKYCGPRCREVARNRELQDKWVNRKKWRPTPEHKALVDREHLTSVSPWLGKFNACRG